jgi:hypothetical protein
VAEPLLPVVAHIVSVSMVARRAPDLDVRFEPLPFVVADAAPAEGSAAMTPELSDVQSAVAEAMSEPATPAPTRDRQSVTGGPMPVGAGPVPGSAAGAATTAAQPAVATTAPPAVARAAAPAVATTALPAVARVARAAAPTVATTAPPVVKRVRWGASAHCQGWVLSAARSGSGGVD